MSQNNLKILFIGDVIGALGRQAIKQILPGLKKKHAIDLTIVNGENSAHGYGITTKIYHEMIDLGIDAFTMGNHMWDKKDTVKEIDSYKNLVRPANYPKGVPGKEYVILDTGEVKVALLNLLGRTFMPCIDCPFQVATKLLPEIKEQTPIIIVDFHAEATSEKNAMGYFLAGKVSAVVGTHTHVMTADERLLMESTAYISDIGMVGAEDSVIGMNREQIMNRFLTQMPSKFEPAKIGHGIFNAVIIEIDKATGRATKIERVIERTKEKIQIDD